MFVVLVETLAREVEVSSRAADLFETMPDLCYCLQFKARSLKSSSCLFANGMKHVLLCSVNVTTKSFGHGFDGCQNLFRNSQKD